MKAIQKDNSVKFEDKTFIGHKSGREYRYKKRIWWIDADNKT